MIGLPSPLRILVWNEPVDLRKGFDGLSALVRSAGEDVFAGHLYVFLSRRRDRLKVLTWQRGGFVILYKRLERGCFRLPEGTTSRLVLDGAQLAMLLDGVDLRGVRRSPDWKPTRKLALGDRQIAQDMI